jgi:phage terminase large subunit-like protein
VVCVDPAETGTGDAAGILVGGRAGNGHLYVLADLSGLLSQAQWARRVCLAVW